LATKFAKDYGVGTEWLHPWNDATELSFSDLLSMKKTA
jgi:hypothetical protein